MSLELRYFNDVLNTRLQAANIIPSIAWPNTSFVPVKGTSYLRVENAGRSRTPLGFGAMGVQQWTGVYQVGVFVPRDSGSREQDELATKVLNAFPRGLTLLTTQGVGVIVAYSSAPVPVAFGDWSNLPVEIHWFATESS